MTIETPKIDLLVKLVHNLVKRSGREECTDTLTELVCTGAKQIIQKAVIRKADTWKTQGKPENNQNSSTGQNEKGRLSRDGMLFKPGDCVQKTWRRQRGFVYPAKVITGVTFTDG